MKEKIRSLDSNLKTLFLLIILLAVVTLALVPLYVLGNPEYPNGLLLGGLVAAIFQLITYFVSKSGEGKKIMWGLIIVMTIRLLVIAGVLVLVGYLFYQQDIKIFHVLTVGAGYLLGSLSMSIVYLFNRQKGEKVSGNL